MPYFEVTRNGAVETVAGALDISTLNVHITVSDAVAAVRIGGTREKDRSYEQFQWLSDRVRPGDCIEVLYVHTTMKATPPVSTSHRSFESIAELMKEVEEVQVKLNEFARRASRVATPKSEPFTRAPRMRALRVSTPKLGELLASRDGEDQLQAVINYTSAGCVVEVDTWTSREDGRSKGKRWLREELDVDGRVEVTYIA